MGGLTVPNRDSHLSHPLPCQQFLRDTHLSTPPLPLSPTPLLTAAGLHSLPRGTPTCPPSSLSPAHCCRAALSSESIKRLELEASQGRSRCLHLEGAVRVKVRGGGSQPRPHRKPPCLICLTLPAASLPRRVLPPFPRPAPLSARRTARRFTFSRLPPSTHSHHLPTFRSVKRTAWPVSLRGQGQPRLRG